MRVMAGLRASRLAPPSRPLIWWNLFHRAFSFSIWIDLGYDRAADCPSYPSVVTLAPLLYKHLRL